MTRWLDRLSPNLLRTTLNLWPPFKFSGIKVTHIAPDFSQCKVILKQRWYNRNYVGTHFGGSMFSMSDPFFMLILLKNLGRQYIVWDKAASIEFIKPGRGVLSADFVMTSQELQQIRERVNQEGKLVFDKNVHIFNSEREKVASVTKTLYVRLK